MLVGVQPLLVYAPTPVWDERFSRGRIRLRQLHERWPRRARSVQLSQSMHVYRQHEQWPSCRSGSAQLSQSQDRLNANQRFFVGLTAAGLCTSACCYCRAFAANAFTQIVSNHQFSLSHVMALRCNRVIGVALIMPTFAIMVALYGRQFPLKANVQQGCLLAWISIPGIFFYDVITQPAQHLLSVTVLLGAAWKWKADLSPTQTKYAQAATAFMLAANVLPLFGISMVVQAAVVFLAEWGLLVTWATMIFKFNNP